MITDRQRRRCVVVPHLPAASHGGERARCAARCCSTSCIDASMRRRVRALVLHADGAAVHAAPACRPPSSTTAWTSSRRSPARRRSSRRCEARAASSAPTSCSPAARASTKRSATSHPNVHRVPEQRRRRALRAGARASPASPADQAAIPHPRIGFFGVIDERMDLELLRGVAAARPDWQLVLVGPVGEDRSGDAAAAAEHPLSRAEALRRAAGYIAGWDVAMLPFARNDATRFISPTKTPEYLAAGKPVVSTSIRDVVRPYGEQGLARIADTRRRVRRRRRARRSPRTPIDAPARRRRVPARTCRGTAPGRGCGSWSSRRIADREPRARERGAARRAS